ncbi:histone-lysine N-methyltransferase SETMAR [Trichonephila clavipes]|nr:histone-lysine N-methyltransferase SETMAR [Trichonephila clavipes]
MPAMIRYLDHWATSALPRAIEPRASLLSQKNILMRTQKKKTLDLLKKNSFRDATLLPSPNESQWRWSLIISIEGITENLSFRAEVSNPNDLAGHFRKTIISQFFCDKSENVSQVAGIVNRVYGADTVTANYVQFWFRRFRSGIFDVKDTLRTDKPIVENVDITEIIKVDRHVSSHNITQELKINHKRVLKHLRKSWIQKEAGCLDATPINIKKHDRSNFHLQNLDQTE